VSNNSFSGVALHSTIRPMIGELVPLQDALHVSKSRCNDVTCPVAGEITIRQPQEGKSQARVQLKGSGRLGQMPGRLSSTTGEARVVILLPQHRTPLPHPALSYLPAAQQTSNGATDLPPSIPETQSAQQSAA
jgi:hypothetical protein